MISFMDYAYQDKALPVEKKDGENKKSARKPEQKFKPPKKITEKYLYNSGLAYLQRFPTSTAHFKTVMGRKIDKSCYYHKEQDQQECLKLLDKTAQQFQQLGLLDDAAYLKGMVTSYRRRGLPARQIELKLRQKGYDTNAIHHTLKEHDLDEYQCENGDYSAALIFARKKRLGPFDITKSKAFDKSIAAMARAGYGFQIAEKILNMDYDEAEEEIRHPSFQ
jgi:regulatory protein